MSREAGIAIACFVLALACAVGALRCLADHLLASAAIYTVIAIGLVGGAVKVAADAL
jgi:hypothetical protein